MSELVDLKFTKDSRMLIGITKPYMHESGQEYRYDIISWDAVEGRRLSQVIQTTQVAPPSN